MTRISILTLAGMECHRVSDSILGSTVHSSASKLIHASAVRAEIVCVMVNKSCTRTYVLLASVARKERVFLGRNLDSQWSVRLDAGMLALWTIADDMTLKETREKLTKKHTIAACDLFLLIPT